MNNDFGFLCVGQAAGNIGSLFEELGYNVLFINTSQEDLDLLKDAKHKYHVEGGEGCAKDRDKAKSLLANDVDTLVQLVRDKLPQKMIFAIFASGGGTGSGLSPFLLSILNDEFNNDEYNPEKRFSAITILPSDTEPLQPAINSYNCCKELLDIEGLGSIFFLDNNSRLDRFAINKAFVKGLHTILSIPEEHKSTKGNVDKAEIKKVLFETSGMASFVVTKRERGSAPELINAMKDTIFAPVDTSGSVLYYVFSTTQEIDKQAIMTEFGEPLDTFSTYNDKENIMLMTGMQPPYNRMNGIAARVKNKTNKMENTLDNLLDNKLSESIGISTKPRRRKNVVEKIDSSTGEVVKKSSPKPNARDLLQQYRR
jgi:hypothetical protein